jgi:tetratricopeptide (TPR) repeat protein
VVARIQEVVPRPAAPAIQKGGLSAEEHEASGRRLTKEKQYAQAEAELNEALRLRPDLATALNARGFLYLKKGEYAAAIHDFTRAVELKPDYANAYKNRSVARRAAGDKAGAAADDQKAASLSRK